jgi:GDP-L-fucose synthase
LNEIPDFVFTPHKNAIAKIREYFEKNIDTLDIETVKNDPYLKTIDKMWKKE